MPGKLVWLGGAEAISLSICLPCWQGRLQCVECAVAEGQLAGAGSGSSLPNLEPGAASAAASSLWGATHHGAHSPGSPHSPASPSTGVSDTPSSLHAQMWASTLPSGTDCSPHPPGIPPHSTWIRPFLGTHHSASAPPPPPPHLPLSQPRSHAGHSCSVFHQCVGLQSFHSKTSPLISPFWGLQGQHVGAGRSGLSLRTGLGSGPLS